MGLSILLAFSFSSIGFNGASAGEESRNEEPVWLDVFSGSVEALRRENSLSFSYPDGEAELSELLADYDVLYAKLKSAAMQHSEYVLFTQDDFTITDYSQVGEVFNALSRMGYDDPEMFFFEGSTGGSRISARGFDSWEAYYYVNYSMDAGEIEEALEECRLAAASLLANVREDMSELEKVLLIHDNIALNYSYDLTYEKFDMYSLISTGEGVCQAYAMLYKHLLGLVGIESEYVKSPAINHEWLRVRIDGEWYHSDATWDDPTASSAAEGSEIPGLVKHGFFLGSDDVFLTRASSGGTVHVGFETGYCTSDRFDTACWCSADVPVVFDEEHFYCFGKSDSGLTSVLYKTAKDDPDMASSVPVVSVSEKWFVTPNSSYYPLSFPGLAMVNGLLVYSDYDQITVCTPEGFHRTALLANAESELSEYGAIFRLAAEADGYRYGIVPGIREETRISYFRSTDANNPGENVLTLSFGILPSGLHTLTESISAPGYLRYGKKTFFCDECVYAGCEDILPLCGKEVPDISDVTALLKYLAGVKDETFDAAFADEDKSGETTLADLNLILRGIAADIEPETEPETEPDVEPDTETETDIDTDMGTDIDTDTDTDTGTDTDIAECK